MLLTYLVVSNIDDDKNIILSVSNLISNIIRIQFKIIVQYGNNVKINNNSEANKPVQDEGISQN